MFLSVLFKYLFIFLVLLFSFPIRAQDAIESKDEFNLKEIQPDISIFADTYYANSSLRYPESDRSFGTQIMKDKQFALNHALVNFEKEHNLFRYALGLHTGTYVQANYAHEPKELQYVYQAFAGIPLMDKLWLDVGIFPSHIGGESAISMLNHNYTRSLIAENSPYYESGARLQYKPNEKLLLGLYVLNGWQKIKDDNRDKAGGLEIQYKFIKDWSFVYSAFGGNEAPDSEKRQTRYFQDILIKGKITEKLELYLAYDLGFQKKKPTSWVELLDKPELWYGSTPRNSFFRWQGFSAQLYYHFNHKWKLGIRREGYYDKNQVIVQTDTNHGYQVDSVSINLDFFPIPYALLRIEGKRIRSKDLIFKQENKSPTNRDHVLIFNFSFQV